MIVDFFGTGIEIPHIITGLTTDPFECEPVVARTPLKLNWIDAEGLAVCTVHLHYRGFKPPEWRCRHCWRNHLELLRRAYVGRARKQKKAPKE